MKKTFLLFVSILILMTVLCSAKKSKNQLPEDDFYEKTRLIMLKSEAQIYKHLPDQAARDQFIEDFWKKRDPTPGTEENENKVEFERRLEVIDRLFRERVGSGRGWESDRGKVFLYLGDPNERSTEQRDIYDRSGRVKKALVEIWVYNYYQLILYFVDEDEMGVYRLNPWPIELLSAMDRAKFNISKTETSGIALQFKTKFVNNEVIIRVPPKKITFDEKDNKMFARFNISLYVYRDYKRIDEVEFSRDISDTKESFLKKDYVELTIPFTPSAKGFYYLDVIVKDLNSGSSYRDMVDFKF